MHARPRVLVLAVVLTLLVCGMFASVALAAPGGKGKTTGATLSVSSSPPGTAVVTSDLTSYGPLYVTGSGYEPGVGVTIVMTSPTALSWFGGPADADGNISIYNTTNSAGTYKLEAYQYLGNRQKATLMASITFQVVDP